MASILRRLLPCMGVLLLLLLPKLGHAEDIDIFVGGDTTDASLPNVIFVLDNTSNWARQSQQWPGGIQQGQAEVRAIRDALSGLTDKVNVGVMEFTTQGNANQDGGYVRFALQKLTTTSQSNLNARLDAIYNDVNGTTEKRNSNTPYGNLMYDVYNYLAGLSPTYSGGGTPTGLADSPAAYVTLPSLFKSPLSKDSLCSKTYLIFIGNPNSSGPAPDSVANSTALKNLYAAVSATPDKLAGDGSGTPLPIPQITSTSKTGAQVSLGFTSQCYADNKLSNCKSDAEAAGGLCREGADILPGCSCSATKVSTAGCNGQGATREVFWSEQTIVTAPTGQNDTSSGAAWNLDDWAKFLNNYGVPVTYTSDGTTQTVRHSVVTYAIDVYNKQPNAQQTGLLYSAAEKVGGGRYFSATTADQIKAAIESVLSDIISVSTTYAAVTLPLSATNRAQNENQVFIGMFRPDQQAKPRWFGNLKRYQVALFNNNTSIELADAAGNQAINPQTGFAAECAGSFWTTNSNAYWDGLGVTPAPSSKCVSLLTSVWSDLPDGPFVEKGGVAQVNRVRSSSRVIKTVSGSSLVKLTNDTADKDYSATRIATLGGGVVDVGSQVYQYMIGSLAGTGETLAADGTRPGIHGDVIHSRPLPINYGGTTGTVVYYGSNDGLFRAVNSGTGEELWSLLAPEHFAKMKRLYDNTPKVYFPGQTATGTQPKDYFFDGPVGQLVHYNSNNQVDLAYIYPTMRRGGRMLYALDVTDPTAPALLWRRGCTDLASDTGCSSGFENIGQTWSTPRAAYLKGYVDSNNAPVPVVIFGGGYDKCEDQDAKYNTACNATGYSYKGRGIYVVNAVTGDIVRSFSTDNAVVADVNVVDVDFDGYIDYAYGVDTGGNIYRVNFVDAAKTDLPALGKDGWVRSKVAYTQGRGHRFMNTPTLLAYDKKVYLAVGSGNRERPLESNYPYGSTSDEAVRDRFYVLLDNPSSTSPVDLDDTDVMLNANQDPGCDVNSIYPDGTKKGWFMRLPGRGEQVVNPAAIAGGSVLFNSYRPGGTQVGMCSRPLGIATAYSMSLFNGSACGRSRSVEIAGGGMPIAPTLSTVSIRRDGCTGDNCSITKTICIGCEGLKPTPIQPTLNDVRKRVYWNNDIDR